MVGRASERKLIPQAWWFYGSFLFCLLLLFGFAFGPISNGILQAHQNALMQQGRQIGQMMFSYATDNVRNGNAYPDGKSSTDVFQKLLDAGYAEDPTVFYVPMPGKIEPVKGQKLKPENVSWDITAPVDSNSSDLLPLVFLTGYRVSYVPSGADVPLIKPLPEYGYNIHTRTWFEWLFGIRPFTYSPSVGIVIFFKGNNAVFVRSNGSPSSHGSIPNFISPDFKPDGKTYRQLTPNGVLP
jgi:hypothetical protein